ncbi:NACHT domain-containing protein [Streptomyces sp. NBC_00885]|uniref:NACHT domain-containing protein n=1 Tax=Streptomyces sp. NBC_00885 TaxID=2975857 RepID=UPI003867292E|nr:NACHT domain-containing protein [Streptomyces sp. NBC_00885]
MQPTNERKREVLTDPVFQQAAGGVIASVVAATSSRFGVTLKGMGNRALKEDEEIVKWFSTYRIAERRPEVTDIPEGVSESELCEILRSDAFHSTVHELLAARLTDATDEEIQRIHDIFRLTVSSVNPHIELDEVSDALFEYYDGEICEIVGKLQGASSEFLPRIKSEAYSARMISSLRAIERRLKSFDVSNPKEEREFIRRYRNHVVENFGKIEPPDFERRRRVSIEDLYVPPEITRMDSSPPDAVNTWELVDRIDRTVLLGDPGGGKTTTSNVIMHWHAKSSDHRVPFLVTLREFASQDPPARSVLGHIEHNLETFYQCPAPSGLIAKLLLNGSALVIFDGLDELIDTTRRAEVTAIVERFGSEYPMARILVTSRLVGYNQARLDDQQFVRYRVGGFDADRVAEYVGKWFSQEDGISSAESERFSSAFMDESAPVSDLRSNPLMLALMCILYRGEGSIPQNRPEVYEQCANLLFRKWDARRRIHTELRARAHVEPSLRHLAHWLFVREDSESAVTQRNLISETANFLHHRGFESREEAEEAADEFVNFCKGRAWVFSDTGTTAKGETLYTFTHRTFLEYFTAGFLASVTDTPEQLAKALAPRVAKQEWEVVAELAVQMKDRAVDQGAARIYKNLLADRRYTSVQSRANLLSFLASCLQSVDPPPAAVRELTISILDHLFQGDLDSENRYAPLVLLLRHAGTYREIVASEINSRIESLIVSGDMETERNALRLAVWCSPRYGFILRGRPGGLSDEVASFWESFTEENQNRYASNIVAAAEDDSGFLYLALIKELVDLDAVLATADGFHKLTAAGHPAGIFGLIWGPFLLHSIIRLLRAEPEEFPTLTRNMESVGRYLLVHPTPPWLGQDRTVWSGFLQERSGDESPHLSPEAFLGAAALMIGMVEYSGNVGIRSGHPQDLGCLSGLQPYLIKRLGLADVDLSPLPVPQEFQSIFERWAARQLDVTEGPNTR